VRLFFAAWPPAETAAALHEWASAMSGRATAAENIHLTLAFLGEADPARALAAAKRAQGSRHELPIEEARCVRDMVWVGPRQTPERLAALAESLRLELYREQFVLERRPLAAHVTLLRKARPLRTLPPLPAVTWPVDEFLLMRSRVSPKGSTYESIERFRLS
jgi:2'-5' RNA ligase